VDDAQVVAGLVRRCVAGDAEAWEEIVRQYSRRIYSVCYRFTGSSNDAEDLAQEVFLKLYRTLSSYAPEKGGFATWVMTVTRNLLVDHFRKTKQDRATDSLDASLTGEEDSLSLGDKIQDRSASAEDRMQQREAGELVQSAIRKLSPELREAVILRDLQDMDYKEIAVVLKVPEGTVKSRINRGRMELARLLSRTYKQVT
jgi:RNA polymerase sigma-70 factor (ECF subfamily)